MAILNHNNKKQILSKNVRKFTSRIEAFDYLSNEVFTNKDFVRHIVETAKENQVSYILAFDIITNYLTDVLYEIDKSITHTKNKVTIRCYGYFSLNIGFMISSARQRIRTKLKTKK